MIFTLPYIVTASSNILLYLFSKTILFICGLLLHSVNVSLILFIPGQTHIFCELQFCLFLMHRFNLKKKKKKKQTTENEEGTREIKKVTVIKFYSFSIQYEELKHKPPFFIIWQKRRDKLSDSFLFIRHLWLFSDWLMSRKFTRAIFEGTWRDLLWSLNQITQRPMDHLSYCGSIKINEMTANRSCKTRRTRLD